MTEPVMDRFKAKAIESHREAMARGEHDVLCEWRPSGFYICNCSKRAREAAGFAEPPGELIHQYPICPRCDEEVSHDGDSFSCPRCKVDWDDRGQAHFYDDYGDLTADLAKWEAAVAEQKQRRAAGPADRPVVTVEPPGGAS